ncbi:hypothetical protein AB8O64_02710 [Streptomyces sp. QH1-20]|uniref:hypothetical protein n=1 Tax=Streptomyces sp. QH1-20 TaxID=3240934 RepID=UPI003516902C
MDPITNPVTVGALLAFKCPPIAKTIHSGCDAPRATRTTRDRLRHMSLFRKSSLAVGATLAATLIGGVAAPAEAGVGLNDDSSVFWYTGDKSTNGQNGMNQASFNNENAGGLGGSGGFLPFAAIPPSGGGGHGKLPKSIKNGALNGDLDVIDGLVRTSKRPQPEFVVLNEPLQEQFAPREFASQEVSEETS